MTQSGTTKIKGACPVCGKEPAAEFRPFCSRRCANVDLNRWLSGVYRIETNKVPSEEVPSEEEKPPEPETKS